MRAGARVGKYVLDGRLGIGGMAEVWAAHAEGPKAFVKPLALKFILPGRSQESGYGEMFFNEARLAAQLHHSNLVTVFDFDRVSDSGDPSLDGRYFIAMERVVGDDLNTVANKAVARGRPIPLDLIVFIVSEVLEGLRYLHDDSSGEHAPVVHRDISPQNVLISFSGEVKVSDFGIAKTASAFSVVSGVRGKLSYFAPEQLRGEKATPLTDQFATGIILWELLSGRMLFHGAHEGEILEKVKECRIPSPGTPAQPVPPALAAVLLRMLAPNPADRYPSAAAALTAITDAVPVRGGASLRLSEFLAALYPRSTGAAAARVAPPPSGPPRAGSRSGDETTVIPRMALQEIHEIRVRPGAPLAGASRAAEGVSVPATRLLLPETVDPTAAKGAPTVGRRPVHGRAAAAPVTRFAPIPSRKGAQFHPDYPMERLRRLYDEAEREHARLVAAGEFAGSLEQWQAWHAERGRDVFSGRPLPRDWTVITQWPRFTNVGWKKQLSFNWHGLVPWGEDGYWVAEDADDDQMMVIFAADLGKDEFSAITQQQWQQWWKEREVNVPAELPGRALPISRCARALLLPNATPPRTKQEWYDLRQQAESQCLPREDGASRRASTSTVPEPAPKASKWVKMMQVAFGGIRKTILPGRSIVATESQPPSASRRGPKNVAHPGRSPGRR